MKFFIQLVKPLLTIIILLGLSVIIYVRFISERLPRAFIDMADFQKTCIIFVTLGIFVHVCLQLKKIFYEKESSSWLLKIKHNLLILINYVFTLLEEFFGYILLFIDKYIIYHYKILIVIARYFKKMKNNDIPYVMAIVLLEMLPRILFHLALLVDIVYLKTFFYSYQYIALLAIPYIAQFFLFMLRDFYERFCAFTEDMLNITHAIINDEIITAFTFKDAFNDATINVNNFVHEHLFPIQHIPKVLEQYFRIKYKTLRFPYFMLGLSFFKLVLFIYIVHNLDLTYIYQIIFG